MEIWKFILLFIATAVSGIMAFIFKQHQKFILQIALSFSGAYILSITVLDLMPTVFAMHDISVGHWILVGFFIQLILEQLSQGIEHGHIHSHGKDKHLLAIQVMLGLCIHAFIEGLPLGSAEIFSNLDHHHHHHHHPGSLFWGILLHKMPAAFALGVLLNISQFSKQISVFLIILFAAMSPMGALFFSILSIDEIMVGAALSVVIGSFLHISTTILFEADDAKNHRISWKKFIAILAGVSIALLTM